MTRGFGAKQQDRVQLDIELAGLRERAILATKKKDKKLYSRRVKAGEMVSPSQDVFADKEQWSRLDQRTRVLATVRALALLHPEWMFCAETAGTLYGLEVGYRARAVEEQVVVHVATTRAAHSRSYKNIRRHVVEGDEFGRIGAAGVTSFWRTVFDCMKGADFGRALAIADSALRISGVDKDEMIERLGMVGLKQRGIARVLRVAEYADARSENGGESIARATIIRLGFPVPELQVVLSDPIDSARTYRVDFYWKLPDGRVIVGELDGRRKYVDEAMLAGSTTAEALADERLRESRLTMMVDGVMRFSFAQARDLNYMTKLLLSFGFERIGDEIDL